MLSQLNMMGKNAIGGTINLRVRQRLEIFQVSCAQDINILFDINDEQLL